MSSVEMLSAEEVTVQNDSESISKKNPFLINPIVQCLLRHLPLTDLKNFRTVCHQWNSVAEPLLRKRVKILFSPSFRPSVFNEYSYMPFDSFKFLPVKNEEGWTISEFDTFFEIWGGNVKSLEFFMLPLLDSEGKKIENVNVNSWLDLLSTNIHTLKLHSSYEAHFELSIEKLAPVKILTLTGCKVYLDSMEQRITPSEIDLGEVAFIKNNLHLREMCYNDVVDFSKSSIISIRECHIHESRMNFDMAKDILNAKKVDFSYILLINWENCRGKIGSLTINRIPFAQSNKLEVKELYFYNSEINLSDLPPTLEKLILTSEFELIPHDDFRKLWLPNLEFLSLSPDGDPDADPVDPFKVISRFTNCPKLIHLEFGEFNDCYEHAEVDDNCIPKTVKKIRIKCHLDFNFIGNSPIEVEILHLGNSNTYIPVSLLQRVETIFSYIKPKVLVLSFWYGIGIGDEFIKFVLKNTQPEKIVVCLPLVSENFFSRSVLSKYVDKQSLYYEFIDRRGRAIEKKEFDNYSLDWDDISQ